MAAQGTRPSLTDGDRADLGLTRRPSATDALLGDGHVAKEETDELSFWQSLVATFGQVVILDLVLTSVASLAAVISAKAHSEDTHEAGVNTLTNMLIQGFLGLSFFLVIEMLMNKAERTSSSYKEHIGSRTPRRLLTNLAAKAPTLVIGGDLGFGAGQNIVVHIPPHTTPMTLPQLVFSLSPGFLLALWGEISMTEILVKLTGKQPKDFSLREHAIAGGTANLCLFIGNGLITFYTGEALVATFGMSTAFSCVLSVKRFLDANQTLPRLLFGKSQASATGAAAPTDEASTYQQLSDGSSPSSRGCLAATFSALGRMTSSSRAGAGAAITPTDSSV